LAGSHASRTFDKRQTIRFGDFFSRILWRAAVVFRAATAAEKATMKWTLVRYRVKPDRADENQRLSAAVFKELQQKGPAGLGYAVFRLPDGTFVHLASLEDGAAPLSSLEAFRAFSGGVRERCVEPPVVAEPVIIGNYGMLGANKTA
jgi:hypothetical protein